MLPQGENMVDELDVQHYEDIIDYFEWDDDTDIQEIYSRQRFEEEWETIPEELKQRILAVDNLVLERYQDWFDYNVFIDYIKMIKNRQRIEAEREKVDCADRYGRLPQRPPGSQALLSVFKRPEHQSRFAQIERDSPKPAQRLCIVLKYRTENTKENMMRKMSNSGVIIRYSEAFKLKVVEEIERGHLTITKAMRLYDIKGSATIYNWIRKYGKSHLLKKIVRIQMKNEKDKMAELERENRSLKSAVASLTLQNICLQSYVEVVEEGEQIDAKKKELMRSKLSPDHQIMLEKLMPNTRKE